MKLTGKIVVRTNVYHSGINYRMLGPSNNGWGGKQMAFSTIGEVGVERPNPTSAGAVSLSR